MAKTHKRKTKSKSRKPTRKARLVPVVVQKVTPPVAGIVRVVVPPGALPIIAHDPILGVVDIVPVPKRKPWWDWS